MAYRVDKSLIFHTAEKMNMIRRQMARSVLLNITFLFAALNQNSENSGSNAKYEYYSAVF